MDGTYIYNLCRLPHDAILGTVPTLIGRQLQALRCRNTSSRMRLSSRTELSGGMSHREHSGNKTWPAWESSELLEVN